MLKDGCDTSTCDKTKQKTAIQDRDKTQKKQTIQDRFKTSFRLTITISKHFPFDNIFGLKLMCQNICV